jgi:pyridoxine kinase
VLGDDPKGLYIAEDAARALATRLVPLADVAFPNRFELAWLSNQSVTDVASAVLAGRALESSVTVATSIPGPDDTLATVAVAADDSWLRTVTRLNNVPNGTGDFFAGLFTGYRVNGCTVPVALEQSVIGVQNAIRASSGQDELKLIAILTGFSSEMSPPMGALE